MALSAILVRHYRIQAVCDKCGVKSPELMVTKKQDGYDTLRRLGWELRTRKKEAVCGKCAKKAQ